MWLPTQIYERMPQLWFLMGVMFFAFGLYIGFTYDLIYLYMVLGAICIVRSIWTYIARRNHRAGGASDSNVTHDAHSDHSTAS